MEPIQRRKLYHEVLDRLQHRIKSGELAPGDHLPSERELMEFYGVGRPTVREALQDMARSGIVEITQGERARVAVPTAQPLIEQMAGGAQHLLRIQPDMLDHLKEARVFLEAGMARLAAERASPNDVCGCVSDWKSIASPWRNTMNFRHGTKRCTVKLRPLAAIPFTRRLSRRSLTGPGNTIVPLCVRQVLRC